MVCLSLFVLFFLFFWPLYCLSFFIWLPLWYLQTFLVHIFLGLPSVQAGLALSQMDLLLTTGPALELSTLGCSSTHNIMQFLQRTAMIMLFYGARTSWGRSCVQDFVKYFTLLKMYVHYEYSLFRVMLVEFIHLIFDFLFHDLSMRICLRMLFVSNSIIFSSILLIYWLKSCSFVIELMLLWCQAY
jgi:hypothetical protein